MNATFATQRSHVQIMSPRFLKCHSGIFWCDRGGFRQQISEVPHAQVLRLAHLDAGRSSVGSLDLVR